MNKVNKLLFNPFILNNRNVNRNPSSLKLPQNKFYHQMLINKLLSNRSTPIKSRRRPAKVLWSMKSGRRKLKLLRAKISTSTNTNKTYTRPLSLKWSKRTHLTIPITKSKNRKKRFAPNKTNPT